MFLLKSWRFVWRFKIFDPIFLVASCKATKVKCLWNYYKTLIYHFPTVSN